MRGQWPLGAATAEQRETSSQAVPGAGPLRDCGEGAAVLPHGLCGLQAAVPPESPTSVQLAQPGQLSLALPEAPGALCGAAP